MERARACGDWLTRGRAGEARGGEGREGGRRRKQGGRRRRTEVQPRCRTQGDHIPARGSGGAPRSAGASTKEKEKRKESGAGGDGMESGGGEA